MNQPSPRDTEIIRRGMASLAENWEDEPIDDDSLPCEEDVATTTAEPATRRGRPATIALRLGIAMSAAALFIALLMKPPTLGFSVLPDFQVRLTSPREGFGTLVLIWKDDFKTYSKRLSPNRPVVIDKIDRPKTEFVLALVYTAADAKQDLDRALQTLRENAQLPGVLAAPAVELKAMLTEQHQDVEVVFEHLPAAK
ncbi:MAG: hypothetical protein KDB14_31330 [Planctomycetales bacterium]|nr:hypothetical protein [Planctomycetales bacterium]